MKIRHKNSREIIDYFPQWIKHHSIYGYVVLSCNNDVLFFYEESGEVYCDDITGEYDIIE